MKTKFLSSLVFISFLFLFLISFSSASSSVLGQIPDVCLIYNVTYYDIWLEDYYDIDLTEEVRIHYHDPVNGNLLTMPSGYASLNDNCFEISYYFTNRTPGSLLTDLIRIESLDESCNEEILVKFYNTTGIDQTFLLNVTNDCNTLDENEVFFNFTETALFDNLKAYYSLDNGLSDDYSSYDLVSNDGYTFIRNGCLKGECAVSNGYSYDSFNSGLTHSGGNFSIFVWAKYNSNEDPFVSFFYDINSDPSASFWSPDNQDYFVYGWKDTVSGDYDTYGDENWHLFGYVDNGTHFFYSIDGSYVLGSSNSFDSFTSMYFGGRPKFSNSSATTTYIDEIFVFNEGLSPSQVSELYNSGTGLFPNETISPETPLENGTIPDVNMNGSEITSIDLSLYFDSYEDMRVVVKDPINDYDYELWTGYSTLNADYYEVYLHNNGTLSIQSYNRSYSTPIYVYACNGSSLQYCASNSFTLTIVAEGGSVILLNSFEDEDLGLFGSETYSGNYYFQYYDEIIFSYPETNTSGILNSTFPWEYVALTTADVTVYQVLVNCTIDSDVETYNILGDINITLVCGSRQAYYTLTAYNNFNSNVWFHATNSFSSVSDDFSLVSGNPDFPSGYIPAEYTSDEGTFQEVAGSFSDIFPSTLDSSLKFKLFWIVFLIIVLSVSVVLIKFGLNVVLLVIVPLIVFLLFFFVAVDWISPTYPILFLLLIVVYLLVKIFKGGS